MTNKWLLKSQQSFIQQSFMFLSQRIGNTLKHRLARLLDKNVRLVSQDVLITKFSIFTRLIMPVFQTSWPAFTPLFEVDVRVADPNFGPDKLCWGNLTGNGPSFKFRDPNSGSTTAPSRKFIKRHNFAQSTSKINAKSRICKLGCIPPLFHAKRQTSNGWNNPPSNPSGRLWKWIISTSPGVAAAVLAADWTNGLAA